jgi:hypothetical protein
MSGGMQKQGLLDRILLMTYVSAVIFLYVDHFLWKSGWSSRRRVVMREVLFTFIGIQTLVIIFHMRRDMKPVTKVLLGVWAIALILLLVHHLLTPDKNDRRDRIGLAIWIFFGVMTISVLLSSCIMGNPASCVWALMGIFIIPP